MTDLSHWDFAEHFSGKELAFLIAGKNPSTEEDYLGQKPIYDRLERSYRDAGKDLVKIAKIGANGVDFFNFDPDYLYSESMERAVHSKSYFHYFDFKTGYPDFSNVYFSRRGSIAG